MYTKQQALEKINSDKLRIEEFVDKELEEKYVGSEISINLDKFSPSLWSYVEELYADQGWNTRGITFLNTDGQFSIYFS